MKISHLSLLILLPFIVSSCKPQLSNEQTKSAPVVVQTSMPVEKNSSDPNCRFILGFDAWEPYQYVDVGDRIAGLDIELIASVIDGMGCQLTYQQGTWVDLLMDLKKGEVDILLGASKTDAREQFAFFSDVYRTEEFSLYIRNGDKIHAGFQSLSDFIQNGSRIGIVGDYVYGPDVSILLDGPETSKYFVNSIMGELNVARLMDGDIDGYIEDSFVGATLLRRKALSDYIIAQGITIQTGNAYVMFSKKSTTKEQLMNFNTQLEKVKNSKEYQGILDKYSY